MRIVWILYLKIMKFLEAMKIVKSEIYILKMGNMKI